MSGESGKQEDLSGVPQNVLKQAQAAEDAMKKFTDPPAQPKVEDQNVIEPAPAVPAAEPAKEPVRPAISMDATPDRGDSEWKHKYDVLKGKYNKEIDDLRGEVGALRKILEDQAKIIEQQNAQQPARQPSKVDLGDDIDPEDFESWGPEVKQMAQQINTLKNIVRDQNEIISGLQSGPSGSKDDVLARRVESLESEARERTVDDYYSYLDRNAKSWRVLNSDQGFNKWLDQIDPISGVTRRVILVDAAQNFRGVQVAGIFNEYVRQSGAQPHQEDDSIFGEIPSGGGNDGFDGDGHGRQTVTLAQVKKAQEDFVAKRISEEEYDKISAQYQQSLARQPRR